jgi:hypothetical protein
MQGSQLICPVADVRTQAPQSALPQFWQNDTAVTPL